MRAVSARPHGLVLVTGPTGSGKTTTLYAALQTRNAQAEKILTVEDPIEYQLNGITQIPVHRDAGVSFATALRAMLRQDPDVVMVGEMRDPETAAIAVQAAMTGHLVFSTVHTNDALGAIHRLIDLGVPAYLVAATLDAVLAQRLVRRICPACREEYRPAREQVALLAGGETAPAELTWGAGCPACRQTGYRGRIGVFEWLPVTDALRDAVAHGASRADLRGLAHEAGLRALAADGWAKITAGLTTVEEVLRVVES
jgi:type IV pilus assembly protein PilB